MAKAGYMASVLRSLPNTHTFSVMASVMRSRSLRR